MPDRRKSQKTTRLPTVLSTRFSLVGWFVAQANMGLAQRLLLLAQSMGLSPAQVLRLASTNSLLIPNATNPNPLPVTQQGIRSDLEERLKEKFPDWETCFNEAKRQSILDVLGQLSPRDESQKTDGQGGLERILEKIPGESIVQLLQQTDGAEALRIAAEVVGAEGNLTNARKMTGMTTITTPNSGSQNRLRDAVAILTEQDPTALEGETTGTLSDRLMNTLSSKGDVIAATTTQIDTWFSECLPGWKGPNGVFDEATRQSILGVLGQLSPRDESQKTDGQGGLERILEKIPRESIVQLLQQTDGAEALRIAAEVVGAEGKVANVRKMTGMTTITVLNSGSQNRLRDAVAILTEQDPKALEGETTGTLKNRLMNTLSGKGDVIAATTTQIDTWFSERLPGWKDPHGVFDEATRQSILDVLGQLSPRDESQKTDGQGGLERILEKIPRESIVQLLQQTDGAEALRIAAEVVGAEGKVANVRKMTGMISIRTLNSTPQNHFKHAVAILTGQDPKALEGETTSTLRDRLMDAVGDEADVIAATTTQIDTRFSERLPGWKGPHGVFNEAKRQSILGVLGQLSPRDESQKTDGQGGLERILEKIPGESIVQLLQQTDGAEALRIAAEVVGAEGKVANVSQMTGMTAIMIRNSRPQNRLRDAVAILTEQDPTALGGEATSTLRDRLMDAVGYKEDDVIAATTTQIDTRFSERLPGWKGPHGVFNEAKRQSILGVLGQLSPRDESQKTDGQGGLERILEKIRGESIVQLLQQTDGAEALRIAAEVVGAEGNLTNARKMTGMTTIPVPNSGSQNRLRDAVAILTEQDRTALEGQTTGTLRDRLMNTLSGKGDVIAATTTQIDTWFSERLPGWKDPHGVFDEAIRQSILGVLGQLSPRDESQKTDGQGGLERILEKILGESIVQLLQQTDGAEALRIAAEVVGAEGNLTNVRKMTGMTGITTPNSGSQNRLRDAVAILTAQDPTAFGSQTSAVLAKQLIDTIYPERAQAQAHQQLNNNALEAYREAVQALRRSGAFPDALLDVLENSQADQLDLSEFAASTQSGLGVLPFATETLSPSEYPVNPAGSDVLTQDATIATQVETHDRLEQVGRLIDAQKNLGAEIQAELTHVATASLWVAHYDRADALYQTTLQRRQAPLPTLKAVEAALFAGLPDAKTDYMRRARTQFAQEVLGALEASRTLLDADHSDNPGRWNPAFPPTLIQVYAAHRAGTATWEGLTRDVQRQPEVPIHLIALAPGLGKSGALLAAMAEVYTHSRGDAQQVQDYVLVAPSNVAREVWTGPKGEIAKFWPGAQVIYGLKDIQTYLTQGRQALDIPPQTPVILLTSYESMRVEDNSAASAEQQQLIDHVRKHGLVVAFDEMHSIKTRGAATPSQQRRGAEQLVTGAGAILGLTGTPVPNDATELHSLLGLGGHSVYSSERGMTVGRSYGQNASRITTLPISLLGLPDVGQRKIPLTLSSTDRQAYQRVRDDSDMGNWKQRCWLQQYKWEHSIQSEVTQALKQGQKVMIGTGLKNKEGGAKWMYDEAVKKYGAAAVGLIDGDTNEQKRAEILTAFRAPRSPLRVVITTFDTASLGTTFFDPSSPNQQGYRMIFADLPYNWSTAEQWIGRLYRQGIGATPLEVVVPYVPGTQDDVALERLSIKQVNAASLGPAGLFGDKPQNATGLLQRQQTAEERARLLLAKGYAGLFGNMPDDPKEAYRYLAQWNTVPAAWQQGVQYFHRQVLRAGTASSTPTLVDLGAGFNEAVAELRGRGWKAYGVDFVPLQAVQENSIEQMDALVRRYATAQGQYDRNDLRKQVQNLDASAGQAAWQQAIEAYFKQAGVIGLTTEQLRPLIQHLFNASAGYVQFDMTLPLGHFGVAPGTADIVTLRFALMGQAPARKAILQQAAALLKPGGRVVMMHPAASFSQEQWPQLVEGLKQLGLQVDATHSRLIKTEGGSSLHLELIRTSQPVGDPDSGLFRLK